MQVGSIGYARFIPERYFCWAPYDEHTYYTISVKINGQLLSEQDIKKRYHYQAVGWEPRAIDNVFSLIRQYETRNRIEDHAEVQVIYRTNGHDEKVWSFSKK
ncbi:hypothetical protein [uncultured Formosa sp.]|uniref:hypothetical protein n=1 Tax=uncultured Formosa sp. TaxID=255435 RepID=UPI00261ABBD7|nr:hypothetical protein [uncultured Formosa sp.]